MKCDQRIVVLYCNLIKHACSQSTQINLLSTGEYIVKSSKRRKCACVKLENTASFQRNCGIKTVSCRQFSKVDKYSTESSSSHKLHHNVKLHQNEGSKI